METTSQVHIISFGYLHPPAVEGSTRDGATITVDVRRHFRDPSQDPALREMTGLDSRVKVLVLHTLGAVDFVRTLAETVLALLQWQRVVLAIGCAGGRHRSVALAEAIRDRLSSEGIVVTIEHTHIHLPVVTPTVAAPATRLARLKL